MPDIFTPNTTNNQPENTSEAPAAPQATTNTPPPAEHHIHALASFCENPGAITFETQEPDEKILLFLRRHFITNTLWILTTIIFVFLPFIINFLFVKTQFSIAFIPEGIVTVIIAFYYVIVFAYALTSFLTWFYNISFVTNKRVVDVDFSDLVYKNIAATKLNLVQDVSYTQVGVIRSIFDYGDVLVQTAGTMDNFDFTAVPHPEKVVEIVENLIGRRPRVF